SERQVSVEGVTHALEEPFLVIATQNPFEFEGTYPLPENQLDRFMMCLSMGYPDRATERQILRSHRHGSPIDELEPVVEREQIIDLMRAVQDVQMEDSIADYLLELVEQTRHHRELTLGVSTRGALTLSRAAQAMALVEGRDYVIPDDIKQVAIPVLAHRVVCRGVMREGDRQRTAQVLRALLDTTPVPT
ncbi:MAG: MoxR family ATPase, partial [Planctomycetaceae bacterium]|nr:MoxR family ATPase [Planctomycetaceae bacterium]